MNFKEYQEKSKSTDKNPTTKTEDTVPKSEVIPLLGLVGEAGVLLSEYKKKLRDGEDYTGFKDHIKEELGDLLWYISNLATKFNLNLNDIAEDNLKKIERLWRCPTKKRFLYDSSLYIKQQLPRKFAYQFIPEDDSKVKIREVNTNNPIGDILTDNSHTEDGYRYHDIMHMTFMAHFGWSPVFRKLLRGKGKIQNRPENQDEVEDGGRAQIIEESIIHIIYIYAKENNFFNNMPNIDGQLLKLVEKITSKLEVKNITPYEWRKAIQSGCKNWKMLIENKGGIIEGDLSKRNIVYKPLPKQYL